MDKVLVYAKAIVAALAGAVIAALSGVDWWAVILSAIGSGAPVARVPNKKKR